MALRFEDATVEKILGPGGLVSQMHPGYEHRPTQIALAKLFEEAIEDGRHAVTEAQTGVGKSFAYIYPGAMAALQPNGPVLIIAVPDKNLQNQLVWKDLPEAERVFREMGKDLKVVLMVGRGNFVCHYKVDELQQALEMMGPEMLFRDHKAPPGLEDVMDWAENDEDGLIDEYPGEIHWELKSKITIDSDSCLYHKCPFFTDCRVERRKEKARDADVIVVNHSLLLRDLQLRFSSGGLASVIPMEAGEGDGQVHAILVIDEAHELEDQATEAFSTEVTLGRFKYLQDRVESFTVHHHHSKAKPKDDDPLDLDDGDDFGNLILPKANERRASEWSEQVQQIYEAAKDYFAHWEVRLNQLKKDFNPTIIIDNDVFAAVGLMELLQKLAVDMASQELRPSWLNPAEEAAWNRQANATMKLYYDLRRVVTPEREGQRNWVRFVEKGNRVVLNAKPIKVGPILKQRLWDVFPSVLVTSATLAVKNTFKSWKERCGAPSSLEIAVESPFDYKTHARIYLPANANAFDPSKYYDNGSDGYFELLANEMYNLVDASDGGAFLLFTSRRVLDGVFNLLEPRMSDRWPLFYHSVGANRGQMLRDIKAINNGVLFGLKSFWKGVDVQGTALRLVVIDKLPYPPPGDPVWEARKDAITAETGDKWAWFNKLSIPYATTELKQGAGRLIRKGGDDTDHDYGVIALLDGRISTKTYGRQILDSLPPAPRTNKIQDVRAFYAARRVSV